MALDPSEYIPVDGSDEPALPQGELPPTGTTLLITYPRVSDSVTPNTYKVDLVRLYALLAPRVAARPTVVFVTPSPQTPATLQAGSVVLLQVSATDSGGIASVTFSSSAGGQLGSGTLVGSYYQLPYTVPTGTAVLQVLATATNNAGVSATAATFAFVRAVLPVPAAPGFANFVDDAAGGSVQLVPVSGVPMADYRYKIGAGGTYVQAPSDGIIVVGNVAGQVFAYSVATDLRAESPAAATRAFTSAAQLPAVAFVAPVNGTTLTSGTTALVRVTATDPGGENIVSVRLYNGATAVGYFTVVSPGLWQIPYTVPAGSATINLRAEAVNENDAVGNAASFVFVTAPSSTPTVPGAPTNATGTAGNGTVSVNATAPASNGGSAVTGYTLYRNSSTTALATNVSLPYADNTASNGTAYTYEVAAVNAVGTGAKSAPSTAVTPAAPSLPSYGTTLSTSTQIADGMSFAPPSSELLKFTLISGTSGASIDIAITSLGATSYITLASEYAGAGYAFFNSAGTRFDGVFPSADNLSITY